VAGLVLLGDEEDGRVRETSQACHHTTLSKAANGDFRRVDHAVKVTRPEELLHHLSDRVEKVL
jgi:hypothetical protein